ncbi:type II toxin -antitoxin system TacA 1-like antitoxin [Kitasatospora griseola]|uniref:type II toxin -antitoxin system TacA 1-like antitoxin n=1 Tax=Kitasatospora griseola TaxID=2064 RepID=UPI003653A455
MTHPYSATQPDQPAGADKPDRGWLSAQVSRVRSRPRHGHHDDGASWGKVHIAVGDADFALDPAPGVPGQVRREGAPDQEVVTEGGHDQDQIPPPDAEPVPTSTSEAADATVDVVREAPTVTAAEFLHSGVPILDRAPLPADEHAVPLADRMYRPRSGTKRTLQLTCSVEPAERDLIDTAAARLERSRSAFLADSALSVAQEVVTTGRPDGFVPLPDREAVDRLTKAVGAHQRAIDRAGNNLNQLVAEIYRGEIPERAMDVLDTLGACATEARLAYQRILPGGRRGA